MKTLYAIRHKETGNYVGVRHEIYEEGATDVVLDFDSDDYVWFTSHKERAELYFQGIGGWGDIDLPFLWNAEIQNYEIVKVELP